MRRWKYIVFSLSSLTILLILGWKLHELDMPAARFVRSFNIHEINRTGDFFGVMGKGIVIGGAFAVVAVAGWWFRREHVRAMGVRGVVAQVGVGVVSQLLKHLI